jgi:hypothetical protein
MSTFSQPPQERDFHCPLCNGRIVIPYSLQPTTGPCPHCQGTITSPPPPGAQAPAPQLAPAQTHVPPAAEAAPQQPAPAVIPPRRDAMEQEPAPQTAKPAPAARKKSSSGIIPAMLGLFVLILAGGGAVYYISGKMADNIEAPDVSGSPEDKEIREANYLRIGWQADAFDVLDNFVEGTSVGEKLPYVHNGEQLRDKMEFFYGGVVINDEDTPADSFSIQELSVEDKKRGIFMLTYDQPPQFALREFFRPLAPLEVQYGLEDADLLLSTVARIGNFSMDPVRVHAFFKRTDSGLKLDWEVFAQTKYRTFQNFVELPDVGRPETFRVLIVEDVPDKGQGVAGSRTYRMVDPANHEDTARVNVSIDSEIGKTLSVINWRGTKQGTPITRTATVELEWAGQPDSPELQIKRFICWEFLGLGGKAEPATASAE